MKKVINVTANVPDNAALPDWWNQAQLDIPLARFQIQVIPMTGSISPHVLIEPPKSEPYYLALPADYQVFLEKVDEYSGEIIRTKPLDWIEAHWTALLLLSILALFIVAVGLYYLK